MGNSVLARILKLWGKRSIVVVNFMKVVNQKSDAVINMELFLDVFWNCWKGWGHEVRGNLKMKVYDLYLWGCGLSFLSNLDGKSNLRNLIRENFVGEKWRISPKISSLFTVENFPRRKLCPIIRKLFLFLGLLFFDALFKSNCDLFVT